MYLDRKWAALNSFHDLQFILYIDHLVVFLTVFHYFDGEGFRFWGK
jgi:hypothetical protein